MNNIDYNKLHAQLIKAVANNKGPEAVPEMKNVIRVYLDQFSGEINYSIDNLVSTANKKQMSLKGFSDEELRRLQNLGGQELKRLTALIDSNFNKDRVNTIVQNAINNHVASVTNKSAAQINKYFADLSNEQAKVERLAKKTDKLSNRLDKANQGLDDADKKFWYGIAITVIVTACVVWIFL